jgi:hypothetical protein
MVRPTMNATSVDLWVEAFGALSVAALLPFYMGYLHLTVLDLLIYSAVAGAALASGAQLLFPAREPWRIEDFLGDLSLWIQLVLGLGLICYLLAILLV